MATMEEKKVRQLRLFNTIIAGFAEGLYDLFGESAIATMDEIGAEINHEMVHELGLEIEGESPENILMEIARVLVDEYGLATGAKIEFDAASGTGVIMCENCALVRSCKDLKEANIPPYSCIPVAMATASLRRRGGARMKVMSHDCDYEARICKIIGKMIA